MRVLVAMSGGIDSSMAASLLCDAGHDVTGVHLKMADTPNGLPGKGCCTLDDARDARRVADTLGIPYYVWDFAAAFQERVIDDFVSEYSSGRTPNPCIRCNERVKYAALLARARAMGFDALATGHHVRLEHTDAGYKMYRPADRAKDQTYVLYMASQEQLAHTLWPVGEYLKSDLRKMAAERGLLTANKPDSHDICFIPAGNLDAFLRPRIGARPGAVIDSDGTHLADHDGAWRFTIGQRKGLGIAGLGEPRFVTAIEGDTITVGRRCDTEIDMVTADDTHWISGRMPSRAEIARLTVQVRYRASALVTDVTIGRNRQIVLKFPKMKPEGVAPGQAVVLYDGDECVGGATVNCTE